MVRYDIARSYAEADSPRFYFGVRRGVIETIERDGKEVGYYLPGDCRCILAPHYGFAITAWICGEWNRWTRGELSPT